MTLSQDEIRERLPLYVTGDLPGEEMENVRRAVDADDSLRSDLDETRAVIESLKEKRDRDPDLSSFYETRIAPALQPSRQPRQWMRHMLTAAAVLLAFLGGLAVSPHLSSGSSPKDPPASSLREVYQTSQQHETGLGRTLVALKALTQRERK